MQVPQAYTDTPASTMRKVIASRLLESKQNVPHYYLTAEVKMDRVLKLRELFNKASSSAEKASKDGVKAGMKLSVNDFVVKAAAIALNDVPEANSVWLGDKIRQYHKADIAIAVATPAGLITPIVTDVGSKGLATISSTVKSLAAKARDNKLQPHEFQGGSFTISNLGMYGIESFSAIINAPQSCILAVSSTEQKLVLDETSEKGFKAISVMKVTLSADHRTVDGAVGARWYVASMHCEAYRTDSLSLIKAIGVQGSTGESLELHLVECMRRRASLYKTVTHPHLLCFSHAHRCFYSLTGRNGHGCASRAASARCFS